MRSGSLRHRDSNFAEEEPEAHGVAAPAHRDYLEEAQALLPHVLDQLVHVTFNGQRLIDVDVTRSLVRRCYVLHRSGSPVLSDNIKERVEIASQVKSDVVEGDNPDHPVRRLNHGQSAYAGGLHYLRRRLQVDVRCYRDWIEVTEVADLLD
jgi:hypothetical protein